MEHEKNTAELFELSKKPEEFKIALNELTVEMNQYKDGIMDGSIILSAEAAIRFQEAIKDLSNPSVVTLDDLTYHTERLRDTRLEISKVCNKGGVSNGASDNSSTKTSH